MPQPTHLERQLGLIKGLVADRAYHYSRKVRQCIEDGWYGAADLERCILTATRIHKVEDDELQVAVDGYKYTILGRDTCGQAFYSCGKVILSQNDERLYFFITAHEAR
ncbi:MAG: hypothetical protein ACOC6F_01920 [bacterium]